MKILKRFLIWLAAMLLTVFAVNAAAVLVLREPVDNLERAMSGYSRRGDSMIAPVLKEEREESEANGLFGLVLRSLLSNCRIRNENSFAYNFLFMDFTVDQSTIFFDENGMNELSTGIFAPVYTDTGISLPHIKETFGVVDIEEFCKLGCASEVYEILEKEEGVSIRLDSYAVSGFMVKPAAFTLLDSSGNGIKSFECPCDGEIIKSENCYIYDDLYDKEHSSYSVYAKMKDAYLGERKSDRIAEELVEKADFSQNEQMDTKRSYGFATITSKHVETIDGYAEVSVLRFCYIKGVILDSAVLGAVLTVILLIGWRKKDRRSADFY